MLSNLFFGVGIPYTQTMNDNLSKLSALKFWDSGKRHYVYIFALEQKQEVEKLINEEIIIEGLQEYNGERIELNNWKGKSTFEVIEKAEYYEVITYQKEKGENPKQITKTIMKNIVLNAWEVVKNLELNEIYAHQYVARKICEKLDLERFFKEGEFKWSWFIGTSKAQDEAYFTYYQTPMRILEYYGVIAYKRNIQRIKTHWEQQPKLVVV